MEPGDLLAERYRLLALIGRGAMGIVWRAGDERLDRVVAVKELLLDPASDDEQTAEATARATREGRIAGRLRHPNAIAVHDVVEHEGRPCLVMEYLPSQSLGAAIEARGTLPPDEVAAIGLQVADALAEAHAADIVHRDVKPDNILITKDGTAKITDFGISRAAGDATVTATGFMAGTPAFLAPEVALGHEGDSRSDVFSFGATLYAALEGAPPFGVDDNPIAMLHKVASGEVRPPERAEELTGLVMWLLRREPGERPSMRGVHDALSAAAKGQPLPEYHRPPPTLMLPARRVSRRTVLTGVAAAGLAAAGVAVGVLIGNTESTGSTGTPGPASSTTASTPPEPACTARLEITNSWDAGYQAEVTLDNESAEALAGWRVRWTLPDGHEINNLWNGVDSQDGAAVTVTNEEYNATVPAGGSTTFGMVVDATNQDRTEPELTCEGD
ncbi:MAG: protein kinase domain-containing protein [Actinophytocola sp.]|uniref:protein kinase domain-containing protein n=1 Tax=Actinophytocola sp. TaxID=1872138 RepID=UPI003D6AF0B5